MTAKTIVFSKVGDIWQATTDSLGDMVLQIERSSGGDVQIEYYIEGMKPLEYTKVLNKDVNIIIPFNLPKDMKLRITSTSEVVKALLMEAVY